MSNRLQNETSPYLLQHAENPVNWYPWGEEAFAKAKQEDKPIFLSVGYSTCHWCHVMAHESFENAEIAEILNRYFVAVKVDREERPDIDSVYMTVCQALTGSGGWPMSVFLTSEQKPFYAGTYFPPVSRYGVIGFRDLLLAIAEKWKTDRKALLESAEYIVSHIASVSSADSADAAEIDASLPQKAAELFSQSFDRKHGGFGTAPKFPAAHNLIFLSLYSVIYQEDGVFRQVSFTLEQMRRGGIFDQIGFGFSRYSTDERFLVPHFEKMLYDNALLMLAYAVAYRISKRELFLDTAEKTADYILREMTGSQGEFYSAQDADSEGQEGKYYVWEHEEICALLGKAAGSDFCSHFGITAQGNFEGKNIPNLLNGSAISQEFERERELLYHHRRSRAALHLDRKILTSWNALMICALSALYRVTGNQRYLSAAEKNQAFIENYLRKGNLLSVSCCEGVSSVNGFLDDYAYYAAALLFLYHVTAKDDYLKEAERILEEAELQFADQENGGYFLYGTRNSSLIAKPKETYDGAMPSGNSVMAYCLVRMFQLTDAERYRIRAEKQLRFLSGKAKEYPAGHALFQIALLLYLEPPQQITIVRAKDESEPELSELPFYADVKILPEPTAAYQLLNGRTTYYVCKNHTCLPPSNEAPVVL